MILNYPTMEQMQVNNPTDRPYHEDPYARQVMDLAKSNGTMIPSFGYPQVKILQNVNVTSDDGAVTRMQVWSIKNGQYVLRALPAHTPYYARPPIITLCGSTRFYDAFREANFKLTLAGMMVLSVGVFSHSSEKAHGQLISCGHVQKAQLDRLHRSKIELADFVVVLNVDGYMGDSTHAEITHARTHNKPIIYLESYWCGHSPVRDKLEHIHKILTEPMSTFVAKEV